MAADPSAMRFRLPFFGAVPGLVLAFAVGIVILVSLAVLNSLLNTDWSLVNVGHESNIPTWFSSVQLLAVAMVLAPIALRDVERRRPRSWTLLLVPGLFVVLSIDEVARLHERLGVWLDEAAGIGQGLPYTGGWFFVVVPAAGAWSAVAAVAFWPYLRERREAVTLLVAGLSLLLIAAVGLEFSSNFLPEHGNLHRAEIFGEEVLEMIAANLILWGAVLIAREEGIRLETGPFAQADPEAGAPTRSSRRCDEEVQAPLQGRP